MKTTADFNKDRATTDKPLGGYEWWYFDAIDRQNACRIVIIFYEGNPFSPCYIRALENENDSIKALPGHYPAVSISMYKNGSPVYYSFTDFRADSAEFDSRKPCLRIGSHGMEGRCSGEHVSYRIRLDERLPSGDAIQADLLFNSSKAGPAMFDEPSKVETGHHWNLVQPRADVSGTITLVSKKGKPEVTEFKGLGYHDHNVGREPMSNEFEDWYWGRFHFERGTLVYYIMNRKHEQQYRGWLISRDNSRVVRSFSNIKIMDRGLSLFGLSSARRIELLSDQAQVTIQQEDVLDNGPFYQRFDSKAFLSVPGSGHLEAIRGISEYLHPQRIHWRLFWPLVNMRIRVEGRRPHWVQNSGRLYRWTW